MSSRPSQKAAKIATVRGPRRAAVGRSSGAGETTFGALSQFEDANHDIWWEFIGNGETTGREVMQRTIAFEAERGEESLKTMVGDRDFEGVAATALLGSSDTPLTAGKIYEFSLKALLAQVTPFLTAYAEQVQRQESASSGGSVSEQDRMIGNVSGAGLSLPLFD